MDFAGYRESGELSDVQVCVDNEKFKLHKFPLFVSSDYFKDCMLAEISQAKRTTIRLEDFPGGSRVFTLVADYFYNKEICINSENVIEIICATEYLKLHGPMGKCGLVQTAHDILNKLFFLAKAKHDYKLILLLVDKAVTYQNFIEKFGLQKQLLDEFAGNLIAYLTSSIPNDQLGVNRYKFTYNPIEITSMFTNDELKVFDRLPVNWMVHLIKVKTRNIVYQWFLECIIMSYINTHVGVNNNMSFEEQHNDIFETLIKDNDVEQDKDAHQKSSQTELKHIQTMETILLSFDEIYTETRFSLVWLIECLNKLCKTVKAQTEPKLKSTILKWIWESINSFNMNSNELNKIPIQVMTQIIGLKFMLLKNKSAIGDLDSLTRLIEFTDYYACILQDNGKLTSALFQSLLAIVPKTYRQSYDSLMNVLLKMLQSGQTSFTNSQLKDVLCLIDFRKLSETVLEQCKLCKLIPQEFVTEAALALCERLRTELNKHKSSNSKLNETKPPYQDVYSSYKLKYPNNSYIVPPLKLQTPSHEFVAQQREFDTRRILENYEELKRHKTKLAERFRMSTSFSYCNTYDGPMSSRTLNDFSYYSTQYSRLGTNDPLMSHGHQSARYASDLNDPDDVYKFYTPISARTFRSSYMHRH